MMTLWQEIAQEHLERSPEFSLKALSRGFVFNSQKWSNNRSGTKTSSR